MNDRAKTRAEIEARLTRMGQTINELRLKAEAQQDKFQAPLDESLSAIELKREEVQKSLQQIDTIEETEWPSTADKLKRYLDDIDAGLRKAIAYYK